MAEVVGEHRRYAWNAPGLVIEAPAVIEGHAVVERDGSVAEQRALDDHGARLAALRRTLDVDDR